MKIFKPKIFLPIIIAGLAGLTSLLLFNSYNLESFSVNLFASIISFCGILIGLLFTSLSILLSIEDRDIIQQIKISGSYKSLIERFSFTINLTFLLLISSIIEICINFQDPKTWHSYIFSAWMFITILSCIKYYQLTNSFINILKASNKKSNIEYLNKQLKS